MVKKDVKKDVKKPSSKVEKKVEHKKSMFPKILQDVEFNLYIMVYLLSIVVLLVSGVLFYTSELLKATNDQNTLLLEESQKYDSYYDVRIISYTLKEFSELSNVEINNIIDIRDFANSEGFQDVVLDGFSLYAKKSQDCREDELRDTDVCRSLIIEYDAALGDEITLISGYQ
jgi:hypothetical protein